MTAANIKMLKIFGMMAIPFCMLLVALSFKFYYALSNYEAPLSENYYEVGRDFDSYRLSIANSDDRALESSLLSEEEFKLVAGENSIKVIYRDALSGAGVANALVQLRLSRLATTAQDTYASCDTDTSGSCDLHFELPSDGRWEFELRAQDADGQLRYHRVVSI